MPMDRPAFPDSLPPRPSGIAVFPPKPSGLAPISPRISGLNPRASGLTPISKASGITSGIFPVPRHDEPDSRGTIKIVLAFLIVGVLANLALTICMTRPREVVEDTPAGVKAGEAIKEITQLKEELARARYSMNSST